MSDSKHFNTIGETELRKRMKTIVKACETQAKAAERLHVSESTVSRNLNEEIVKPIKYDFLEAFTQEYCGGDMVYLLTGEVDIDKRKRDRMLGGLSEERQKILIELYCLIGEFFKKFIWND